MTSSKLIDVPLLLWSIRWIDNGWSLFFVIYGHRLLSICLSLTHTHTSSIDAQTFINCIAVDIKNAINIINELQLNQSFVVYIDVP